MKSIRRYILLTVFLGLSVFSSHAQVENVPINNQVYEFLDRLGVKGILPLYSNVMIPLSRREVADLLITVDKNKDRLSPAEVDFLEKFKKEFAREIDPQHEDDAVIFRDGFQDVLSDKQKYLYEFTDSNVTSYIEFLGSAEYHHSSGDTYGSTHAAFETHGGRIRGTIEDKLGYYLQGTDGTLYGDKTFALSDPHLRGNVKFNNLNSPYFDFTEAYLKADFGPVNLQFGREYNQIGTGYDDRLLLSNNAPAFDFLKLEARYKSVRLVFLHGSIVGDSTQFPGLVQSEPQGSQKYFAMHRLQFSGFDRFNFGVSEMIIYQRFSPDFAYLNPVIFYKSVEHSLGDRDNAFLSFDLELFPLDGYKLYGTWLIDDIDFSKLGTGWWGNEFGWQGGVYATDLAGLGNLDGVVEYTRLEPYVYSNRTGGDDFTNNNIGLGHHLEPNSDEWFFQFGYRPMKSLRAWLGYTYTRHGDNIVVDGQVVQNVGGNILQGHRDTDPETALFLAGNRTRRDDIQLRAAFEPITNFIITGSYEFQRNEMLWLQQTSFDHYAAIKVQVGY
jgi:hypothetical protein